MSALVGIGILTTVLVREPLRSAPQVSVLTERRVIEWLEHRAHWPARLRHAGGWFLGAVVCPVLDFFARYGVPLGVLLFAFISTYRMTDYAMGVMSDPFYLDLGFTLKQIAAIVKIYGTVLTIVGILLGGVAVAKLGRIRSLVLGSALVMISNLSFRHPGGARHTRVIGLATVHQPRQFRAGRARYGTHCIHVEPDQCLPTPLHSMQCCHRCTHSLASC